MHAGRRPVSVLSSKTPTPQQPRTPSVDEDLLRAVERRRTAPEHSVSRCSTKHPKVELTPYVCRTPARCCQPWASPTSPTATVAPSPCGSVPTTHRHPLGTHRRRPADHGHHRTLEKLATATRPPGNGRHGCHSPSASGSRCAPTSPPHPSSKPSPLPSPPANRSRCSCRSNSSTKHSSGAARRRYGRTFTSPARPNRNTRPRRTETRTVRHGRRPKRLSRCQRCARLRRALCDNDRTLWGRDHACRCTSPVSSDGRTRRGLLWAVLAAAHQLSTDGVNSGAISASPE